jgi:hypothetical protein
MKTLVGGFFRGDFMFSNMFRDKKNERLGLLLSVIIFGAIAMLQLWRAFSGVPVELNGHTVPIWLSIVAGAVALVMSCWMGMILRHNRPLL